MTGTAAKTPATKTAARTTKAQAELDSAQQTTPADGTSAAPLPDAEPATIVLPAFEPLGVPVYRNVNDAPAVLAAVRTAAAEIREHIEADAVLLADVDTLPAEFTAVHANTSAAVVTLCGCIDALARVLA